MRIEDLSSDQCILLTVHYASSANLQALHSFTPARLDVLDPELVLRIVLTYLPETIEPKLYTTYVSEVGSRLYLDVEREDIEVDTSPVKDISVQQARKQVKHLDLLPIQPPHFPSNAPKDILTRFICHRAYRIDQETGALALIPQLVEPFLDRGDYIKTWYISVVLPVLRLNLEYYPAAEPAVTLVRFEGLSGKEGVHVLLSNSTTAVEQSIAVSEDKQISILTRDITHLVGPWMYGHTNRTSRLADRKENPDNDFDGLSTGMQKVSLTGITKQDRTGHDWEACYYWLVSRAETHFPSIAQLIDEWDGPSDIDLGGYAKSSTYLDAETQQKLEAQYAQAAFASCYAAQASTEATVRSAHAILARLAELLDFIPPPDLATSVDNLPLIEDHAALLEQVRSSESLVPAVLLTAEHPLTTPRMETYMLLQMFVYSAYQLAGLGHSLSIVAVAKLHFYNTAEQQRAVLTQILSDLSKAGRRDDAQWSADRARLLWLWNWGIKSEDTAAATGSGVLGRIPREEFEAALLEALVDTNCYKLAMAVTKSDENVLSEAQAEVIVYNKIMEAYDSASNGNKSRGSMKKANDILLAFRGIFMHSQKLDEATALIAATHALSFYSLILQHGVPFKPVNIRAAQDPIELISKVLEQNNRSFTHLDDLIGVANNFVLAGLPVDVEDDDHLGAEEQSHQLKQERQQRYAARRVTFMAVEAALREDDFETAYSYIINRLTPANESGSQGRQHSRSESTQSTVSKAAAREDDISWRAAYLAGRYRSSSSASPPTLRRLEQRKELLSLALLLAPTTVLTDVLSAWRRCEEETSTLLASQQDEEREFDDKADRREPSALPGNFTLSGDQPEMILNQKRREMGRMTAASSDGDTGAPLSMFDLTRNAARALSRNVNLGQAQQHAADNNRDSIDLQRSSDVEDGDSRVRRRDMVANAVSGGLANGIGWVLGAKPANQQRQ